MSSTEIAEHILGDGFPKLQKRTTGGAIANNNHFQNGDSALRYLCRTNAYGPTESIFHDCHRFL